jgi:hypothetical protein
MSTPTNPQPVVLAKIDVAPHAIDDGTWFVMLKVQAANGMVEVGLLLSPEHAKAIANTISITAQTCKEKIVVPRSPLASA